MIVGICGVVGSGALCLSKRGFWRGSSSLVGHWNWVLDLALHRNSPRRRVAALTVAITLLVIAVLYAQAVMWCW
jgi:hypothetical protein